MLLHSGGVRIRRSDLLVALGLLLLGQAEIAMSGVSGDALVAHVYWATVAVAAVFRRTTPTLFAAVAVGGLVPVLWLDLIPSWSVIFPVAAPLAVFGVGLYTRSGTSAVQAVGFALIGIGIFWANQLSGESTSTYLGFEWVRVVTIYLGAAGAGILLRDRTDAVEAARVKLESLPPAETEIDNAVTESRQEIAREVHAVVRRCLDRIQTAIEAAQRSLNGAPEQAVAAVEQARALSRQAMDEMRSMLGLLRADPVREIPDPEPAPGWLDLAATWVKDQALVLLLLANGLLSAYFTWADAELIGGDLGLAWRMLGATATAAVFIPRRRWPVVPVVGVPVLIFIRVYLLDDRFPFDFFVWSAIFVAAAYLRPTWKAALGGAFIVVSTVSLAVAIEPETPWQAIAAASITALVIWLVGMACRDRVAQTLEIEEIESSERQRREEATRRAIREQRLGVARELHDLVGHSLTAITLQCAGVERMIPTEITKAEMTLGVVQGLSKEASGELASLFVALSGLREPVLPKLDAVPELVERIEDRGQDIQLETTGDLSRAPVGPGAAAYRILQESLNNAGKYSSGPVRARVDIHSDGIEVLVLNPDEGGVSDGFNLGLVGIRERAEAYGGKLTAGPDGRGQWRVQAELPLPPATTSPLS